MVHTAAWAILSQELQLSDFQGLKIELATSPCLPPRRKQRRGMSYHEHRKAHVMPLLAKLFSYVNYKLMWRTCFVGAKKKVDCILYFDIYLLRALGTVNCYNFTILQATSAPFLLYSGLQVTL